MRDRRVLRKVDDESEEVVSTFDAIVIIRDGNSQSKSRTQDVALMGLGSPPADALLGSPGDHRELCTIHSAALHTILPDEPDSK
jgi:hypothetical protein